MKENNISQSGDYDAHSLYNNTRMGLGISLCSNSNHLIILIPQTASNFRHLLSCGTIGIEIYVLIVTFAGFFSTKMFFILTNVTSKLDF